MSRLLIKEENGLTFKTISPHHHLSQTVGGGECDVRQPIVNEGLGFHAVISQRLSLDQIPKWRIKEWPKCRRQVSLVCSCSSDVFYKTIRHSAKTCSGRELLNCVPLSSGVSGVLVYYLMPGSQQPAALSVAGTRAAELTFLIDWFEARRKTGAPGPPTSDASPAQGRWRPGQAAQEAAGGAERAAGSKAAGAPPGLVCGRE